MQSIVKTHSYLSQINEISCLARLVNRAQILAMNAQHFRSVLAACLSLCLPQIALAETIVEHDGGVVQVFFEPVTPDTKTVRGVIAFDNEPGWKSYWRDPGSSGIPPQINIMIEGQPAQPELFFPVPQWVHDDYGGFIGYIGQTNVPFEITVDQPLRADTTVNLDLFAGICREVCIPIAGQLTATLPRASATQTSLAQVRVQNSFDALPSGNHPGVRDVHAIQKADGTVIVTLHGQTPQTSFAVGKRDGKVVMSFGPPQVLATEADQTTIAFAPRGRFDPDAPFDLHFVAALAPHGYLATLPVEKEK